MTIEKQGAYEVGRWNNEISLIITLNLMFQWILFACLSCSSKSLNQFHSSRKQTGVYGVLKIIYTLNLSHHNLYINLTIKYAEVVPKANISKDQLVITSVF